MSIRECDRCRAYTSKRRRCKLRTCVIGPFCWIHTKQKGLQIKDSGIPNAGKGLFTLIDRAKGDKKIVLYTGQRKTKAQVDAMPDTSYVYKVTKNHYIDASKTNSGPARYINMCRTADDKKGHCKTNAKFYRTPDGKRINLKAKKIILQGLKYTRPMAEIFGSGKVTDKNSQNEKKKRKT